jgi:transcriptional regulator with XRE-family HTH domain
MFTCTECGGETLNRSVLPTYETDLGGIKVRLINCVIRETCGACGEASIEIPDLDGLAKAVAMTRALVPIRLTGKEVRFMRLALDMTGREFAEAMDLTPETVSRWENGGRGVGGMSEKLLRHNICGLLHKEVAAFDYDPADIARMKILAAPEEFELPTLEFRRVIMKASHEATDEVWDRFPLQEAA